MPTEVENNLAVINREVAADGIELTAGFPPEAAGILNADALRFVASLARRFEDRRDGILVARQERQNRIDAGELPGFDPATAGIREGEWTIGPVPEDLRDRRVEITGPVERKMIINALNSGAKVFMADFEDSHSPTWAGTVLGQANLYDAVRRTITFEAPNGRHYALKDKTAVLMMRPRGWHLDEAHMLLENKPVSASLFDFGLFFFHNAAELASRGSGPYFYLPKLESAREAALWNDVFIRAQQALKLPRGTIKATVLIETILAAFEMDEILHALKEHSAGLNCGRWDYIFSFIKKFARRKDFVLPDRALVTMTTRFLRSYSKLLIKTCHRRGAHAMGGMAAQIPIKSDPAANDEALAKVRADKEREAGDGHDGTWVAHPGLVAVAAEIFDRLMPGPNQIDKGAEGVSVSAEDLLAVPEGTRTEAGLRLNLSVGVQYLAAWLSGTGCVPLYNLMEDAATSEISRAQVWQWVRHGAELADGRPVTLELVRKLLAEETAKARGNPGTAFAPKRLEEAAALFDEMIASPDFTQFLTIPAYKRLQ